MDDGRLQEDGNVEEVRWYNLDLQHRKEGNASEGSVSRFEELLFRQEATFSPNGSRWALLFDPKKDASAKFPREKLIFFNERNSKKRMCLFPEEME